MALRRLAGDLTARTGLRWSLSCQPLVDVRVACCRAFATVEQGLKYAKSHEWAKVDGDIATIGISDFAQSELGDIVYVELPEVGSEVVKGQNFGVVESVKAASDVYSPVSGEVTEANADLTENPNKVNTDAFGAGWMLKVKLSDKSQLDDLLDAAAYEKTVAEAEH